MPSRVYCKQRPLSREFRRSCMPKGRVSPDLSKLVVGQARSNTSPCDPRDDHLRRGLGPSLRIRSVICCAAFANAWAWLPDM